MTGNTVAISILVFAVEGLRCAFLLNTVIRVFQAVETTVLPHAPPIILGVINLRDTLVPVVDFRRRLGLTPKGLHPDDKFILSQTSRQVVVAVDSVEGLSTLSGQEWDEIHTQPPVPVPPPFLGAAKTAGGLLLIYDLERFLSQDEESALQSALEGQGR